MCEILKQRGRVSNLRYFIFSRVTLVAFALSFVPFVRWLCALSPLLIFAVVCYNKKELSEIGVMFNQWSEEDQGKVTIAYKLIYREKDNSLDSVSIKAFDLDQATERANRVCSIAGWTVVSLELQ